MLPVYIGGAEITMNILRSLSLTYRNLNMLLALLVMSASPTLAASKENEIPAPIKRTDRHILLANGEQLHIREVRQKPDGKIPQPSVLLIHGARVPGLASFDLPVKGGSLAADLALAGFRVYILDLRGYGLSSRPAAMDSPPDQSAPLIRTADAVTDIAYAVQAIQAWSGSPRVSLLGWATGGHWAGAYAAQYPQNVERLVLYNTLYGGTDHHPLLGQGSPLDDPQNPGHFNAAKFGGWNLSTRDSLFVVWDNSIPVADKTQWRDETVKRAYGDAALASDNTSQHRTPHSFRAPTGAMADSFELAMGRKQWSATALTTVPVLVVRSERDFWSRPEDVDAIMKDAPTAEKLVIPDATHFVHLDRDNAGRQRFLQGVVRFLAQPQPKHGA
ncbi:alpha/beta hydrolase [Serratia marcescens]|uniref:alpha/beta fold hydrolase n=2 Tax=Serratia TaxID=613 RepID=UPI000AF834E7|nr:alpha/beta hydrolase [Serratia marcescens]MBH2575144.1 alpha/beta hydrolase [Serratia marcescens]MDI3445527.1 alpha/beta hydrolase [Serratia marcescens]BEN78348.1 alpha/beta hydrolase [Serratia marcescens]BEO47314.1 alpha/beta hydrolase [Serratia marcescens]